METGQTVWKKRRSVWTDIIYSGVEQYFFFIDQSFQNEEGWYEDRVYKGNVLTGEVELFYHPEYSRDQVIVTNVIGIIDYLKGFKNESTGELYLVIIFTDPQHPQAFTGEYAYGLV